ncbi:hypothetical protein BNJ_00136 [Kaumoebavirus]|uniref:hypothetical protein n=1 Tax=Kaumoebavirus TaxID=1859492 RepID=UPI0009C2C7C0|nr:hypothetical protein BNJ_00136 [Kaumoebavirus]ARA71968.1 hypothetical protein BNJ_00136 [Kaumoebavirus]
MSAIETTKDIVQKYILNEIPFLECGEYYTIRTDERNTIVVKLSKKEFVVHLEWYFEGDKLTQLTYLKYSVIHGNKTRWTETSNFSLPGSFDLTMQYIIINLKKDPLFRMYMEHEEEKLEAIKAALAPWNELVDELKEQNYAEDTEEFLEKINGPGYIRHVMQHMIYRPPPGFEEAKERFEEAVKKI